MEYQYQLDSSTGGYKAIFSYEHQVFGPWLETEVSNNQQKLIEVLTAIDEVSSNKHDEIIITGCEYTLTIDQQDVAIRVNSDMNGESLLAAEYSEQDLSFDETSVAMCGLEDFRQLILSWSNFVKN